MTEFFLSFSLNLNVALLRPSLMISSTLTLHQSLSHHIDLLFPNFHGTYHYLKLSCLFPWVLSVFLHQNVSSISTGTFSVLLTTESPLHRTASAHSRLLIKVLNKWIRVISSNNKPGETRRKKKIGLYSKEAIKEEWNLENGSFMDDPILWRNQYI